MRRTCLILVLGVMVIPVSCGLFPTGGDDKVEFVSPLDLTPRENEEAELMALWLSGELVAPEPLYDSIRTELAMIREQWADSLAAWDDSLTSESMPYLGYYQSEHADGVVFSPSWEPGKLHLYALDDSLGQLLRSRMIEGLDETLEEFRVYEWHIDSAGPGFWTGWIKSGEMLNCDVMTERINSMIGQDRAFPYYAVAPTANIFRYTEHGKVQYFWVHMWRWMHPGSYHYFYFEVNRGKVDLIDSYEYIFDTEPAEPPIWVEKARQFYRNWYFWSD